jgi:hypothetical protein
VGGLFGNGGQFRGEERLGNGGLTTSFVTLDRFWAA